jgi:DNA-binding GntR family transcriptional regulator
MGSTQRIVDAITTAIVERRLMPGTKLAEQSIADIFKVSRTLVRQALNQLSRDHLVTLEPARGAFVAQPSVEEARQVFEVRKLIEASLVRQLCAVVTPAQVAQLRAHLQRRDRSRGAHRCPGARACWLTFTSCWRACWATRCWRNCWPICSAAAR